MDLGLLEHRAGAIGQRGYFLVAPTGRTDAKAAEKTGVGHRTRNPG